MPENAVNSMLKKFFAKENLFVRVFVGFAAGILLGLLAPQFSIATKVVGDVYLISMVGKYISMAVHIDKENLLLHCSICDQRGLKRDYIENLFVEIFHTYNYRIYP